MACQGRQLWQKEMAKKVIKRRTVFNQIQQDTVGDHVHIFSIVYRKKGGALGVKPRVSKSVKNLPGTSGYRQNVNINHVLLLTNQEDESPFEVLIDLLVEYNGMIIDHTI